MHRTKPVFCVIVLAAVLAADGLAQDRPDGDLYYAVGSDVTLYSVTDTTRPYVSLRMREPVFRVAQDSTWIQVRTSDGARGVVRPHEISNVWLRVSKKTQTLYVYRGAELIKRLPADLGYNFYSDKVKRGSTEEPDHWRTPVGAFYVVNKNPASQYHRALVLNYPSREDAERGLRDSLITGDQYRAILRADSAFVMPPMNTLLGGWIEIHGDGTGRRANWTQGCIAIRNEAIDTLWDLVHVGTPVVVEP